MVEAADALEAALAAGLDPEAAPPRASVPVGEGELLVMPAAVGGARGGQARHRRAGRAARAGRVRAVRRRDAGAGGAARRHRAHQPPHGRRLRARRAPAGGAGRPAPARVRPRPAGARARRGHAGDPPDRARRRRRPRRRGRDELVAAADVICCCTTAREPLFDGALVADHACVVAIGSHEPDAREVDEALVRRATVVVEARAAALREAGDVIAAGPRGRTSSSRCASWSRASSRPPGGRGCSRASGWRGRTPWSPRRCSIERQRRLGEEVRGPGRAASPRERSTAAG